MTSAGAASDLTAAADWVPEARLPGWSDGQRECGFGGADLPAETGPRPLRDDKYRLVFEHPCGTRKTCATTDPVRYGTWCPRCVPDDGTDTFDFPPAGGWQQVFEGASG